MEFEELCNSLDELSVDQKAIYGLVCAERVLLLYRLVAFDNNDAPERSLALGWSIALGDTQRSLARKLVEPLFKELHGILPDTEKSPISSAIQQAGASIGMGMLGALEGDSRSVAFAAGHAVSAVSNYDVATETDVEGEERWQELALDIVRKTQSFDRNSFDELNEIYPPFAGSELSPNDERFIIHIMDVPKNEVVETLAVGPSIQAMQNYASNLTESLSKDSIFIVADEHNLGNVVAEGELAANGDLNWNVFE